MLEEYIGKIFDAHGRIDHDILDKVLDDIVNICTGRILANKDTRGYMYEWLIFNNIHELIRIKVRGKLEKEDYFK